MTSLLVCPALLTRTVALLVRFLAVLLGNEAVKRIFVRRPNCSVAGPTAYGVLDTDRLLEWNPARKRRVCLCVCSGLHYKRGGSVMRPRCVDSVGCCLPALMAAGRLMEAAIFIARGSKCPRPKVSTNGAGLLLSGERALCCMSQKLLYRMF